MTGVRGFLLLSFGQLVSLVGFQLTGFALTLAVLERTGSVTASAMVPLFTLAAILVVSPIAGALVDRHDRRLVMIASDLGAGGATLLLLAGCERAGLPLVYAGVALVSALRAIQWSAHPSVTTSLVPAEHLHRAAGLLRLCDAIARLVVPLLGAAVLVRHGPREALALAAAGYAFSALCLLFARVPPVERAARPAPLLAGLGYGVRYFAARRRLRALVLFVSSAEIYEAAILALLPPLVLRLGTLAEVGRVLALGGLGMVAGSLAVSAWSWAAGARAIVAAALLEGAALVAAGLAGTPALLGAAAFAFFLGAAVLYSCGQAIVQTEVEPAAQGRVFAVTYLIALPSGIAGYLAAGLLADGGAAPLRGILLAAGALALVGGLAARRSAALVPS